MDEFDLDMIIERDGVAYGCEVKNTWDYIDREELRVKIGICNHIGIRPLFVMRYGPKPYFIEDIRPAGGIWLLFEAQIYPYGLEDLARRIREQLQLKADTPPRIPDGIIERFLGVHGKVVSGEI